jgi:hypothetical protein
MLDGAIALRNRNSVFTALFSKIGVSFRLPSKRQMSSRDIPIRQEDKNVFFVAWREFMFTTLAQKHSCLNHSHLENTCFDKKLVLIPNHFLKMVPAS